MSAPTTRHFTQMLPSLPDVPVAVIYQSEDVPWSPASDPGWAQESPTGTVGYYGAHIRVIELGQRRQYTKILRR